MDNRILEVFRIIFPVFAIMGLGIILRKRNLMNDNQQKFLTDLAFYFALPALIFTELAVQPFYLLLNPVLILGTMIPMGIVFLLYTVLSKIMGIKGVLAAPVIFGTFWANVGYMGFPLVSMAYGEKQGIAMAAIVNAISMPVFVVIAFLLMSIYGKSHEKRLLHSIKAAFINPIIIASFCGLLASLLLSSLNLKSEAIPDWITLITSSFYSFLDMAGTMGLPLALIAVGGSLRIGQMGKHLNLLLLTISCKLLILPLITYFFIIVVFQNAQREALGVSVLLMATPVAVASTIVSARFKIDTQFVSSLVALSTILSSVTIPVWLYILL